MSGSNSPQLSIARSPGRAALLGGCAAVLLFAGGCSKSAPSPAVQVELHMMSRCPFAGELVASLVETREHLGERMSIKVHYIGQREGEGFKTMYGAKDVEGDRVQLCAKQISDETAWLRFLACQQQQPELIPDNWPDCAKAAGVDPGALSDCTSKPIASQLLRSSFALSAGRGIKSSPTLLIQGKKYEGGRLTYHIDRAVCAAMDEPKHPYCDDMDEPPALQISVVAAPPECKSQDCDTSRFKQFVERNFPGAELHEVPYESEQGKRLFAASQARYLPVAIFGPAVERRKRAFTKLSPHVKKVGDAGYAFAIGKSLEPSRDEPLPKAQ